MRTIGTDFKKAGKHFVVSMAYLTEAVMMALIIGVLMIYQGMNGRFLRHKITKPYVYLWKTLTWGIFVWVVFTYVGVPFFAWWGKTMTI